MYGNKDLDATIKVPSMLSSNKKFEKIELPMSNVKKSDSYVILYSLHFYLLFNL